MIESPLTKWAVQDMVVIGYDSDHVKCYQFTDVWSRGLRLFEESTFSLGGCGVLKR